MSSRFVSDLMICKSVTLSNLFLNKICCLLKIEMKDMNDLLKVKSRKLNVNDPSVEDMLQIINLNNEINRPIIKSSWRKSPDNSFKEMIRTIEQCWDQNPDGRISAALVAVRMRQLFR